MSSPDPPNADPQVFDEELWAATAVAAVTGATLEPYDRAGRQGAVDFLLHYEDGRAGALEVTSHAEPGNREVHTLLARDRYQWPNPGTWAWAIAMDANANLKRLRQRYAHVITTCEAHNVTTPDVLPFDLLMSDNTLWAAAHEEMGVRFRGYPDNDDPGEYVSLLPGVIAGGVDDHLVHLPEAVSELLRVQHVAEHVLKLARHDATEQHLFIAIGAGGIPFPQYYPLCGTPAGLPTNDPDAPAGLSHLWLATGWGNTLLGWSRHSGWTSHNVFAP